VTRPSFHSRKRQGSGAGLAKDGWARLAQGHPWLYAGNLAADFPAPQSAGFVSHAAGLFAFSPQSEIRLRSFGLPAWKELLQESEGVFDATSFDRVFGVALRKHLAQTLRHKRVLLQGESCLRWIFSECDFLPGLVVDLFGNEAVAQIQTAPMEAVWESVRAALEASFRHVEGGTRTLRIHELRSTPARRYEGLAVEAPPPADEGSGKWIPWNGLEWELHPGRGQKTGAYLDQRDNHLAAVRWAKALNLKSAWDLCCFEGGFGLHLAKAGLNIEALDQSAAALATARRNARKNGIADSAYSTVEANVFDVLSERSRGSARSPLIVLDPPGFVRSRKEKDSALRGFKELNLRALQCLEPGGLLVTCACSYHVSENDYGEMLASAAGDAGRRVRILEVRGPAPDHAPRLGFPESRYLQAWYLEVL
jgi:23S rRNA (cytosine1962-C5)-methyltransferase